MNACRVATFKGLHYKLTLFTCTFNDPALLAFVLALPRY
jgi:hypothetical protein